LKILSKIKSAIPVKKSDNNQESPVLDSAHNGCNGELNEVISLLQIAKNENHELRNCLSYAETVNAEFCITLEKHIATINTLTDNLKKSNDIICMNKITISSMEEKISALTDEIKEAHIELEKESAFVRIHKLNEKIIDSESKLREITEHIELKEIELSSLKSEINRIETWIPRPVNNVACSRNYDSMSGDEFERYCVGLLERNGYVNVEKTQAGGDKGVDVFAEKDGVSFAIQCKCYSSNIGISAIQEVYSGKDYYKKHIAAVLTNREFTKPAIEKAEQLNVILWGKNRLENLKKIAEMNGEQS